MMMMMTTTMTMMGQQVPSLWHDHALAVGCSKLSLTLMRNGAFSRRRGRSRRRACMARSILPARMVKAAHLVARRRKGSLSATFA